MGEFAGYALGECLDAEEDRDAYRDGRMSSQDAYDLGIIDHEGFMPIRPMSLRRQQAIAAKTCRACGAGGLKWGDHGGKWRLFCGSQLHTCTQYRA